MGGLCQNLLRKPIAYGITEGVVFILPCATKSLCGNWQVLLFSHLLALWNLIVGKDFIFIWFACYIHNFDANILLKFFQTLQFGYKSLFFCFSLKTEFLDDASSFRRFLVLTKLSLIRQNWRVTQHLMQLWTLNFWFRLAFLLQYQW